MCTKILGRSRVYPRLVEKPALVPDALKRGVRLTPGVPGCQAGIALPIHTNISCSCHRCKHSALAATDKDMFQ